MDIFFIILFALFLIFTGVNVITMNYISCKFSDFINFSSVEYFFASSYPFHVAMYFYEKKYPEKENIVLLIKVAYLIYYILGHIVIVYLLSKFSLMVLEKITEIVC